MTDASNGCQLDPVRQCRPQRLHSAVRVTNVSKTFRIPLNSPMVWSQRHDCGGTAHLGAFLLHTCFPSFAERLPAQGILVGVSIVIVLALSGVALHLFASYRTQNIPGRGLLKSTSVKSQRSPNPHVSTIASAVAKIVLLPTAHSGVPAPPTRRA